MLLSAILATTLLTGCGNAPTPSLENIEPTVTNVQFVSDPQATRAAPNVNATGGTVKFEFNTAMDRASVENAINIFKGEYNESLNPPKPQKLQLTSTCNGRWNVNNPNDTNVSFHWSALKTERDENENNDTDKDSDTDEDKLPKTAELSDGVVPANSSVQFNTVAGKSLLRVFVNKKQHGSKVAKKAVCTTPLYTFTWSADSRSVSVKPLTPLVVGQKYTAVLSTNARIANGSRSVKEPVNYSFVASGREFATVQAGGSVTFSNGIRVDVPKDRIDPIELFIEEVPASTVRIPLEVRNEVAVSPYYLIGTTGDDTGSDEGFRIIFPVPDGENYKEVGVVYLDPDQGGDEDNFWHGLSRGQYVNNLPYARAGGMYHQGSIFALAKRKIPASTNGSEPTNISIWGNTRSASSFEVSCFNDSECSPEILTTVKNYTYDAYNHWLDIMSLQLNEYPKVIKVIIQSIYTGNCLENAGIKGQYVYKDEFIYICIKKLTPLRPWEFRSSETIKETIFHEMFHGVQYGIASSVQISPKDLIKFHYSTKWIIEATAAAAANSGITWNTSNEWANKSVNTAFYAKSGSLADVGKYYRVHDYWIYSLPSILATKNLFKVNKNRTYTKDDLDYNVQLVTELLGKIDPNYIRDTYWKWVKSQSLELNKDFLEEGNPCSIFRKETENEISGNSVDVDFDATFLKKDATAIAKIPKTLPATPLTSRLWNFTFTNVPDKRYIHFKLSSNQPNAKFHIYKLPKNLPAGYTGCQDPDGIKDYTDNVPANTPDPRDFEVDNDTRIVVLGSNLEYVNSADLKLEMGVLKPKIALSTNSISLTFDENNGGTWTGDVLKIANIGDVNSVLEYQMYAAGTHPNPNPMNLNTNGFPEAQGTLSNDLIVVDETPGYIIKQNNVDVFEQYAPVHATCTRYGSFTIPIYISSKTGNFAADGTPLFDTNIVTYQLNCIAYTGCSICRKSYVPPLFPNLTIQTTPSTSRRIMLKNVENTLAHKVSFHTQTPRASNHQLRDLLSRAQLYESLPKPQILARAVQHARAVQFHDS